MGGRHPQTETIEQLNGALPTLPDVGQNRLVQLGIPIRALLSTGFLKGLTSHRFVAAFCQIARVTFSCLSSSKWMSDII